VFVAYISTGLVGLTSSTSGGMPIMIMNLSVSAIPFSDNRIAGVLLMVSVTDANGGPYTGLQKPNFHVKWIFDGITDVSVQWTVKDYRAVNNLPEMPGVYALELMSENDSWSSSNVQTIYIALEEDSNHGQILHTVDPSSMLPPD
jgi:hypothetical protein